MIILNSNNKRNCNFSLCFLQNIKHWFFDLLFYSFKADYLFYERNNFEIKSSVDLSVLVNKYWKSWSLLSVC